MWDKIIDLAITNGLWAVMFLGLLVYLIKDGRTRENKYQNTISSLNKSVSTIEEVKEDVKETKETIVEIKRDVTKIKGNIVQNHKKKVS